MNTLGDLLTVLSPVLVGMTGSPDTAFEGVSTDTRTVRPGNLFVALRGERFDGHAFVGTALEAGAVCAVLDRPVEADLPQIIVTDTGRAYGLIAKAWRSRFAIPLTAVGGSNGKTTTTQMLACVLRERWGTERMCATQGNFNNEVGVPRMLLTLGFEHRGAVFECGMNHPGEMARLADWVRPTVVLITNAQREHQEFLNGVEETARENGLLIVALPETGTAVYPADDACAPIWEGLALARGVKALTYATAGGVCADVTGRLEGNELVITTPEAEIRTTLAVTGAHNVHDAVGAAAAALAMGIDPESVAKGLAAFRALRGRGERTLSASGRLTVIDDAYNANPDSVRASMVLLSVEPGPRTFVLGDMGEIGDGAEAAHREVGAFARTLGIDALYAAGPNSKFAVEAYGDGGRWFESTDALIEALRGLTGTVTVKASNFMKFGRIADALKQE